MTNAARLYMTINAHANCVAREKAYGVDPENNWRTKHAETIENYILTMPSGAGFLSPRNPTVDNQGRVVVTFDYGYYDDHGYFLGWYEYEVILTPTFFGVDAEIRGAVPPSQRHHDPKDYFSEVWHEWANRTDVDDVVAAS